MMIILDSMSIFIYSKNLTERAFSRKGHQINKVVKSIPQMLFLIIDAFIFDTRIEPTTLHSSHQHIKSSHEHAIKCQPVACLPKPKFVTRQTHLPTPRTCPKLIGLGGPLDCHSFSETVGRHHVNWGTYRGTWINTHMKEVKWSN